MRRTLISHFYNEEYLLPWFLNHHKQVFHHGIMIDYHSTDRSREIIREICPTWEIRDTRNELFDAHAVDQEVMDIEEELDGWRMCLNVTEQLIGDYSVLNSDAQEQLVVPCLILIDTDKDNTEFSYDQHLYEQYSTGAEWNHAFNMRLARGIHRVPVKYPLGRHYQLVNSYDLITLYYGWCPYNQRQISRKVSMGDHMNDSTQWGRHHITTAEVLQLRYEAEIRPFARDQSQLLAQYILKHEQTKISI